MYIFPVGTIGNVLIIEIYKEFLFQYLCEKRKQPNGNMSTGSKETIYRKRKKANGQ